MQLCILCSNFDVRDLLLKATAQVLEDHSLVYNNGTYIRGSRSIRPGIQRYFAHQPGLLALRGSADTCELCAAIWKSHERSSQAHELRDDVLASGVGAQQLWIGTNQWDTALHSLPHVVVSQFEDEARGFGRKIAWFEVCAERGSALI